MDIVFVDLLVNVVEVAPLYRIEQSYLARAVAVCKQLTGAEHHSERIAGELCKILGSLLRNLFGSLH